MQSKLGHSIGVSNLLKIGLVVSDVAYHKISEEEAEKSNYGITINNMSLICTFHIVITGLVLDKNTAVIETDQPNPVTFLYTTQSDAE